MIPTLTADWIWLAILTGGVLIGLGIRGMFADRARRRILEDARQESVSAEFRSDESAGRVRTLQEQLAELRSSDERTRLELATAMRQIAELEALALRLRESEQQLRDQQAGWQEERAALVNQLVGANQLIAASNETIASLDETRNQLQLAEARFAALQTQHEERIALLARQLSEQESTFRGAADRGGEITKMRSRLAELEPRARMAADWQARHDIVQNRLAESDNDRSRLRHRLTEAESRITQLDNSLEERDLQIRRLAEQLTRIEPRAALVGQHEAELDRLRAAQGDVAKNEAQIHARDSRIRDLENHVARLRQRVLELEPLRGELQVREQRLRELLLLAQLKDSAYDEEIARLGLRIAELEGRTPDVRPAEVVQEDRQGQSM
jgi:chromosome segregation ATPase